MPLSSEGIHQRPDCPARDEPSQEAGEGDRDETDADSTHDDVETLNIHDCFFLLRVEQVGQGDLGEDNGECCD
ncbi:hypothetical protein GCM10023065_29830 [Microbacterium laevaniformans]|nr:MAG: hypothetical protein BGN98_08080 [Microbacterium sp. 69-7]GLJ63127.1 hypothetical protein GCM10017578_00140 [Microbacterium laevaniformans]